MIRLSVIVPTIARPTLERTLASIGQHDDEVVVVSQLPNVEVRNLCRRYACKYFEYFPKTDSVAGGAMERRYGITQAKGDWLVFLDDDDVMAPGGLEIIRKELADGDPTPRLFRVQQPGGFIWGQHGPSLNLGEVTGSQFVCRRAPVPDWPHDPSGDHPFINQTIELQGGRYKAVDRVIILIRPEQI